MVTASPSEAAAELAEPLGVARLVHDLAAARAPTLGAGRLVCLDGPGGSGKTTLAAALAALAPGTAVVHMDDLYDGWSGLRAGADQLVGVLRALDRGRTGTYRRFDWHAGGYAETVTVPPAPLLVVEGVGAGVRDAAGLATVLVWVAAPSALRLERGLARDGEHLRAQWEAWRRDEDALFSLEGTAQRADLVVDGTGETPPTVRS